MFSSPLRVDFEITHRCPLNCGFCMPYVTEKMRGTGYQDLNTKEICQILDKLSDAGVRTVFFTGGEPLMRRDFIDIVKYAFDVDIIPNTSTSGVLINKKLAREIKKTGMDYIQVSLLGPNAEINDKIVNFRGGFKLTMEGIKNLVEEGFNVTVATVGTKINFEHLPDMVDLTGGMKVQMFRILRLMTFTLDMLKLIVPADMLIEVITEIHKRSYKYPDMSVLLSTCPFPRTEKSSLPNLLHPVSTTCQAGKLKMDILPDGTVVPCLSFRGTEFVIGNIITHEVVDLWNHPKMRMFRTLTPAEYNGKCGKCSNKWSCYSCRAISYLLTGNIYGDDISCYELNPYNRGQEDG